MRRAVLLAALLLALALALAGCGDSHPSKTAAAAATTSAAPSTSASPAPAEQTDATTYAPPPVPPVTSSVVPPVTPQSPAFDASRANRAMCQITSGGGKFWLNLASADEHDYSACETSPLQPADLDVIFASGPGVDRRCVSNADQTDEYGALIGVYSSSNSADLAAAQLWCDEHGMTNN